MKLLLQITNIPTAMDPNSLLITASLAERQPHFYRYVVHYDNDMKPDDKFEVSRASVIFANLDFQYFSFDIYSIN